MPGFTTVNDSTHSLHEALPLSQALLKLMHAMAILELKKWGELRGQEKSRGQHKCLSCMVIFRCFED